MAQMDMGQVISLASLALALVTVALTTRRDLAFSLTDGACLLAQSYDAPEIIIDRVEGRR